VEKNRGLAARMRRKAAMKVMKYRVAFATLMLVSFAAPSLAQFEISPSHFGDGDASAARAAAPQQQIQRKIAEQKTILADCQTRIQVKSDEIAAVTEDLGVRGNEAGQAEALWIHQRELESLRAELAPQISTAKAILASLQTEITDLAAKVESGSQHPAVKVRPTSAHRKPSPATSMRAALGTEE